MREGREREGGPFFIRSTSSTHAGPKILLVHKLVRFWEKPDQVTLTDPILPKPDQLARLCHLRFSHQCLKQNFLRVTNNSGETKIFQGRLHYMNPKNRYNALLHAN